MNEKMTAEEFEKRTGSKPRNDDLARVNCTHAGEPGHAACGWCHVHNLPRFQCGCRVTIRRKSARLIIEGA